MPKITQYKPAFFEGFENKVVEFTTNEELFNIDFVKRFSENPKFYRYSVSDNKLMCELDEGKDWYVIGFIEGDVDLPVWKKADPIQERIDKAIEYISECEKLYCQGVVFSKIGYHYKDVVKAIKIAAGYDKN